MDPAVSRRLFVGGSLAAGTILLTSACQSPEPPVEPVDQSPVSPTPAQSTVDGFLMAVSGVIGGLDPLLINTAEQTLLCRQIYERIIGVDPNTGAPTPTGLASEWDISDDGLTYTFVIAPDKEFHDGTVCDAAAVATNIERWANLPELIKNFDDLTVADVFADVFGDEEQDEGRGAFRSVEASSDNVLTLRLHEPLPGLLAALAHTAFSICSPTALAAEKANSLSEELHGVAVSKFALTPVGTGPYRAEHRESSVRLTAVEDPDESPTPSASQDSNTTAQESKAAAKAEMRTVKQDFARLRLLEQGKASVMADLTPEQLRPVLQQGLRFLQRDPFGMAYLGINHSHPVLRHTAVRELLVTALDKNRLAGGYFLSGTKSSQAFTPPSLAVPTADLPSVNQDAAAATAQLEELLERFPELEDPITLYFPTDSARTWLPLPERTTMDIAEQLAAIGLNIRPVPISWHAAYQKRVHVDENVGLYLWGHVGAYRDPLDFLAPIVSGRGPARDFTHSRSANLLAQARNEEDSTLRQELFGEISALLATQVAAVPLCNPLSALALANEVLHYPTSPVLDEEFDAVRLNS